MHFSSESPVASSDGASTRTLYDYPGASSKIRLISGCATVHGSYWVGYTALQATGMASFNTQVMYALPSVSPSESLVEAGLMGISSPHWSVLGLGLSAIFMVMAKINAACVVRRMELTEAAGGDGGGTGGGAKLAVHTHTLFGDMAPRHILEPWNVVSGGGVVEFNESRNMVTFLPAGYRATTFYNVIDTENGEVFDKPALLAGLKRCLGNSSEASVQGKVFAKSQEGRAEAKAEKKSSLNKKHMKRGR